jgi:plasmid rolling circle replication initiator protein Rep
MQPLEGTSAFPHLSLAPSPNGEGKPMSKFYLSDLSDKDKPWDKHRFETDIVASLYQQVDYERLVERLDSCSQNLLFAISNEGIFTLEAARFCRVRYCPTCQWRRQLMWKARFHKALPEIEVKYHRHRWLMLTLTVRNCAIADLRETVDHMNQSWKRLSERKNFPAIGFIRSTEVTRSQDGTAHPHFHALLLVKGAYFKGRGYLKQADWTELWQQCLRVNYSPVVDVRAVKAISDAAKEVLKYTVKPADLIADPQWLMELTKQLHKTRAVSVGGVLKQCFSGEEPTDEELIHGEEAIAEISEDDPRFIATWQKPKRRYEGELRN